MDVTLVHVFGAAKTVADCFKFRNKIAPTCLSRRCASRGRSHPKRLEALWCYAEVDRVTQVIRPYLEAIR